MPKFKAPLPDPLPKSPTPRLPKSPTPRTQRGGVPKLIEPRCKVCQHPQRDLVDQMLVAAVSYSEIERTFDGQIPRRSISNHKENHLGYEQAAIRAVIEREALAAQQNYDEGVERLVTKQTYLEVAIQKAYDQLINGAVEIPAADAVKLIETQQRLQEKNQSVFIDEIQAQFNAFLQAVKETVPKDFWEQVVNRTHELLAAGGHTMAFEEGSTPVPDAEVVEIAEISSEENLSTSDDIPKSQK